MIAILAAHRHCPVSELYGLWPWKTVIGSAIAENKRTRFLEEL